MNYTINQVCVYLVVLIAVIGLLFVAFNIRDWWQDRFGYDPLEHWRKKKQ